MTLLSCISLLMFGSLVRVEVCAAPVKAKGKSREIMKAMIFPKVLNEMRPQLEKIKVPQYMLDLFAYMTDNKTGRRRANISLPGNIIRSFYSEALPANKKLPSHVIFNITDIPNTEVIRKAEFHIYRRKCRYSSEEEKKQPCPLVIMVTSLETEKIIDIKRLNSKGFGWVRFDVTSAVQNVFIHQFRIRNILLKLSVAQAQSRPEEHKPEFVFRANDIKQPSLVVYTDKEGTAEPSAITNKKPNLSLEENIGSMKTEDSKKRVKRSEHCYREDMLVNFVKLGYGYTIIRPLQLNAYKCTGTCSSNNPSSSHAYLQSLVSELRPAGVTADSPCCAPTALESRQFLLIEKHNPGLYVLKEISGVVVKTCGCS